MSTRIKGSWQLALLLSLGAITAVACGDDEDGGDEKPPVIGDGDGEGDGSDGNPDDGNPDDGDTGDGNPDDGDTGDGNPDDGDTGDGDDGCLDNPTTNLELLNSCPPEGVERRAFDNDARLPDSYTPGQPLPELP